VAPLRVLGDEMAGATIDWTRSQGPAISSPKTRSGATMRAYQPGAGGATESLARLAAIPG